MREIRDLKKQIRLNSLGSGGAGIKIGNLIADLANTLLKLVRRFAARFLGANLFTQSLPVRVQLLQRRFHFSAFRIHTQYLIDVRLIAAASGSQPLTDEIRLLANQTDIEHG